MTARRRLAYGFHWCVCPTPTPCRWGYCLGCLCLVGANRWGEVWVP